MINKYHQIYHHNTSQIQPSTAPLITMHSISTISEAKGRWFEFSISRRRKQVVTDKIRKYFCFKSSV